MELPLSDFNLRDLVRELYGHDLSTEGTRQELHDRLMDARHEEAEAQAQGFVRPGRPPIEKFGACVQPDDFGEIACLTDEEYVTFYRKVQWRLRRVLRTYYRDGLEYYYPGVLHRIDHSKSYIINMSEFWIRQHPYLHKMFVIFVTRTNGEQQRLLYARSLARRRMETVTKEELLQPFIKVEDIGRAISNIMLEIEDHGLENFVAIVIEKNKVTLQAMRDLKRINGDKLPPVLLDSCNVYKQFETFFCSKSSRALLQLQREKFLQATYKAQLRKREKYYSECIEGQALMKEYFVPLPKVLLAMWQLEEHKEQPISLFRVNNERLKIYCDQVQNDLPPITFEDCAAGAGILQLILFDALWCRCDGPEREEDYPQPAPVTPPAPPVLPPVPPAPPVQPDPLPDPLPDQLPEEDWLPILD